MMIEGEIIKIDSIKGSRNKGEAYRRVYFRLKGNKKIDGRWAKTDLVPTFRNFKRWQPMLKEGNILGKLILLDDQTVDADSIPFKREHLNLTAEDEYAMKTAKEYML